jgi:hypothetical protein
VDDIGLLHFHHCRIIGDFVIQEAKPFEDGKCNAGVVGHVGGLRIYNPYDMMKPVSPVIGVGLQDIMELFLQGGKVTTIQLANDGRLGVQSILEEFCDIR